MQCSERITSPASADGRQLEGLRVGRSRSRCSRIARSRREVTRAAEAAMLKTAACAAHEQHLHCCDLQALARNSSRPDRFIRAALFANPSTACWAWSRTIGKRTSKATIACRARLSSASCAETPIAGQ